jgi:ABC-type transporter Mla subunit MlaD
MLSALIASPPSRERLPALVVSFSAASRNLAEPNRPLRRFFPSVDAVTALLRRHRDLVSRILRMANRAQRRFAQLAPALD